MTLRARKKGLCTDMQLPNKKNASFLALSITRKGKV